MLSMMQIASYQEFPHTKHVAFDLSFLTNDNMSAFFRFLMFKVNQDGKQ
jgi:hypothetical protein